MSERSDLTSGCVIDIERGAMLLILFSGHQTRDNKQRATELSHRMLSGTMTTEPGGPLSPGMINGRVDFHGNSVSPETKTTSGAIAGGTVRGVIATSARRLPQSIVSNAPKRDEKIALN